MEVSSALTTRRLLPLLCLYARSRFKHNQKANACSPTPDHIGEWTQRACGELVMSLFRLAALCPTWLFAKCSA